MVGRSRKPGLVEQHRGMDLATEKEGLFGTSLARETKASCDPCEMFCRIRNESPLLYGEPADDRLVEEEQMLDFVVHLTKNMSRAPSTVKKYVSAISTKHEMLDLHRPSDCMRRVKLALRRPGKFRERRSESSR